jgi:hypothetical protein
MEETRYTKEREMNDHIKCKRVEDKNHSNEK